MENRERGVMKMAGGNKKWEENGDRKKERGALHLFVSNTEWAPITPQKELIQEAWVQTLGLCMCNEH